MLVRQLNRQVRIIKDKQMNAAPYKLQSNNRTVVNYTDNPSCSTHWRQNWSQQKAMVEVNTLRQVYKIQMNMNHCHKTNTEVVMSRDISMTTLPASYPLNAV